MEKDNNKDSKQFKSEAKQKTYITHAHIAIYPYLSICKSNLGPECLVPENSPDWPD